ncbi:hypothetical protein A3A14_00050 [Candidatus Daviesbacteria bacterium RIFCSPLOWO2_01_FULL_43_38]|uniref:Uncharacterized protein n=1 Tax=Candidatus Daviesbacteria bacterium RIFCSPHIGHO2_12_FULL_43_11 TaxID=1797780 RepID=A0A1F5K613_9BACT|nr:MAG: hypothetical protein A3E45_00685 [Candidatus Daviesbacteria bacterium RIFCSPHIGHO2_12_FULL_43_11]OGE63842.1 MAG: hypothetical protein A3A14_00050 [Candidatus Daviesbacteria bacterium RIFCSPLOWO2_01_FULL_43_38]OGE69024.1 MAG: hypothetical protein A3J21_02175 [Candidatus Daviesbacteria bacterium RIFCSPLOWO2_02_FULL_43_11]
MPWQDLILSSGTVVLILALLPSVLSKDKPAIPTSIVTGIVMSIFAFVYASLTLWFTAGAVSLISLLWFILAVQKKNS